MLLLVAVVITAACSKHSDPPPPAEEPADEDTVTFPHIMFASEKKGKARLFTKDGEIFDSVYASVFVADAASFFFEYAEPPVKLQFESKDTQTIFYSGGQESYGIHKEGNIDFLYDSYPRSPISEEDTSMVAYTINPQTGFVHDMLTGYGDYKEYKIPIFSYLWAQYRPNHDDSTKSQLVVRKMSWKYNDFKETFFNTLEPLDTFAIQEYELVYKKY